MTVECQVQFWTSFIFSIFVLLMALWNHNLDFMLAYSVGVFMAFQMAFGAIGYDKK